MNPFEILHDDKKNIATIHEALFRHVSKILGERNIEVAQRPATIETGSPTFEIQNLGLLRFGTQKGLATYALGSSDPQFFSKWKELFPTPPADPAAPVKTPEFEIMKTLFMTLDGVLKANGSTIDNKSVVLQEEANLGDWKQVKYENVLRLPLETKAGDLVFEIPLFTSEFVKSHTQQLYGFKENARILVVDDSLVSRKYSRSVLSMAGYFNIDEAADGQAALTKVMGSTPRFDLVVADWHMPQMSGFEMLKKIRAIDEFKKLPVMLITGEKNKEEVIAAIKEGVTAYLVKPVQLGDFLKALKKAGGRG